jgi:DnaJ-class molecular chaperone
MEKKTYYMMLGVSSTESASGIRAAYRDLAKRLHPDVAGPHATQAFRDVNEAYAILSDPEHRRDYNDKLKRAADRDGLLVHHGPPEPMVREPVAVVGHAQSVRPSFDEMTERIRRNFTGIGVPKSEQLEALNFEVLLTVDESVRGCVVRGFGIHNLYLRLHVFVESGPG